jgi:hypothetical protein
MIKSACRHTKSPCPDVGVAKPAGTYSSRRVGRRTWWSTLRAPTPSRSAAAHAVQTCTLQPRSARLRTCRVSARPQHRAQQHKFEAVSWRVLGSQELAEQVAAEVRALVGREDEVWAVTHSMGGIILRHIQALPDRGALGRRAFRLICGVTV